MSVPGSSPVHRKDGPRLRGLFQIVEMLTQSEGLEKTIGDILLTAHRTLPMRDARLDWSIGVEKGPLLWQPEAGERLETSEAEREYLAADLTPRCIELSLASGGRTLGRLRLECCETPDGDDLGFARALTHHLTLAVDRWLKDAALLRSQNHWSSIMDAVSEAIVSADRNHRIVQFNRAAERAFGYSAREAVGAPLNLLLPERLRAVHTQHVRDFSRCPTLPRAMGDERSPVVGRRKSGEEFPVRASILNLEAPDEPMLTAVLRDITEERRLEDQQRFFAEAAIALNSTLDFRATLRSVARLAVRCLADVCIIDVADAQNRVQRMEVAADSSRSALALELGRYPLAGKLPALSRDVFETGKSRLWEIPPDFAEQSAQDVEHGRILRELHPRQVIGVPIPVRGHSLGAIVLLSCDEKRRYGPRELRMAEELARRAEVAIDNAVLYELAQRAIQARDDLLAVVSHDLANALSSILISLAVLEGRTGTDASRQLSAIQRSAEEMRTLLCSLMDTARADAGVLSVAPQPVRVDALISCALEAAAPVAESKRLHLSSVLPPLLPAVLADSPRIQQVLSNLLSNAMKFTPQGGRILVRADPCGDEVRFSVSDTGSGIAPEDLPHLFDRFWQARTTADLGGAGLGLFIAQQVISAHGGTLWAESTPGAGTTFFFTLPAASPPG